MSVASLNLQNLYASQLAALNASNASSSTIGNSTAGDALFAELITSLNGQSALSSNSSLSATASMSPTASTSATAPIAAGGTASGLQKISQDLDAFMQSLQQALALTQTGSDANGSGAVGSSSDPSGVAGTTGAVHHGHHGHSGRHGDSAFNQLLAGPEAAAGANAGGQLVNTEA